MSKKLRKVTAVLLSVSMMLAMSLTALADEPAPDTTAGSGQILDYKIQTQVVPTAMKLAINPNGYVVNLRYTKVASDAQYNASTKYYSESNGTYSVVTDIVATGDSPNWATKLAAGLYTATTSEAQIISFNYGLANKSTVDRKITVKLDVAADEKVEFVDTLAKAQNTAAADDGKAQKGEYKIFLQLVPAKVGEAITTNTYAKAASYTDANTEYYTWDNTNSKYVGPTKYATEDAFKAETATKYTATQTIGTEIRASELADVTMQNSTAPITFAAKKGTTTASVAYKLPKATYTLKANEYLEIGKTVDDLQSKFEMTGIGGLGGFTITGNMNTNTEWSQLTTKTITITPTYKFEDATGLETAVTTGLNQVEAVPANVAPSIAVTEYTMAEDEAVTINLNYGSGNLAATGVASITYTAASGNKTLADTNYSISDGVLTITAEYINGVIGAGVESRDYTIKFNDEAETTVTITLAQE